MENSGAQPLHESERRSPTRLVSVHGPKARLFEAVGTSHEPGNADGAVGARFVPNRSADIGTGAEPTQRRGFAERCELRQLALRRQGKFMAGEQVQMEQEASHEPDYCGTKRLTPARSPFCSADGSTGLTTHSAKRGEGETVAASERIGNVGFTRFRGSMREFFRVDFGGQEVFEQGGDLVRGINVQKVSGIRDVLEPNARQQGGGFFGVKAGGTGADE